MKSSRASIFIDMRKKWSRPLCISVKVWKRVVLNHFNELFGLVLNRQQTSFILCCSYLGQWCSAIINCTQTSLASVGPMNLGVMLNVHPDIMTTESCGCCMNSSHSPNCRSTHEFTGCGQKAGGKIPLRNQTESLYLTAGEEGSSGVGFALMLPLHVLILPSCNLTPLCPPAGGTQWDESHSTLRS